MAEETIKRVLAEAALAKRLETDIIKRASISHVETLVESVEKFTSSAPGGNDSSIAIDDDGIPYITV